MRKISEISHSQINTFEWCPRQWALRYLHKIDAPKSHALVFGIAFHEGIEKFLIDRYRANLSYDVALNNAISSFEFSYIFGEDTEEDWIKRGGLMLSNMCEVVAAKVGSVVQTEKFYKRELVDGVMFSGKVDCVAKLNNGETVIIDWKTASKNYMPSKVKKDKQLTFYRWLVDKDYPLAFVVANKETGEVQWHDTIRSQGQIDTALQMAIRAHQEMQEREEFRGVYNNKCDYCEYNGTYCGGNVGDF